MTCEVYGAYHDYNVPVEGAPHSRQCAWSGPKVSAAYWEVLLD